MTKRNSSFIYTETLPRLSECSKRRVLARDGCLRVTRGKPTRTRASARLCALLTYISSETANGSWLLYTTPYRSRRRHPNSIPTVSSEGEDSRGRTESESALAPK